MLRKGLTGNMKGKELATLPYTLTSWKKWKKRHPDTLVLSKDTGHRRNYSKDPYEDYYKSPFSFFKSLKAPPILPEKTLIFGIEVGGNKRAYPVDELKRLKGPVKERIGGVDLRVTVDSSGEIRAEDKSGRDIPGIITYWFVWHKFHPKSGIYGH